MLDKMHGLRILPLVQTKSNIESRASVTPEGTLNESALLFNILRVAQEAKRIALFTNIEKLAKGDLDEIIDCLETIEAEAAVLNSIKGN